ncbi:hypothetical protein FRC03_011749 [Tulasnella sp. 419]|nr:hypothetical protein FRC02_011925 [Tulasnella sp. 418]KAG8953530.1 hypothetical protein FRC03_011749 [Tulasnella sp. 419]
MQCPVAFVPVALNPPYSNPYTIPIPHPYSSTVQYYAANGYNHHPHYHSTTPPHPARLIEASEYSDDGDAYYAPLSYPHYPDYPTHPLVLQEVVHGTEPRHVLWDVRDNPDRASISTLPHGASLHDIWTRPAVEPPARKMRLISRDFPWEIIIQEHHIITVHDILHHIYKYLQTLLTEGEWWIATPDDRERASQAHRRNRQRHHHTDHEYGRDYIMRVDWLGHKTRLHGISKTVHDEEFIRERFADHHLQEEAWVLHLGVA